MFEGPEIMSRWTPEQRNDVYRRLGIKVLALPDGGVEIEGIVELRSPRDTTYIIGMRPHHSKKCGWKNPPRQAPSKTSTHTVSSATPSGCRGRSRTALTRPYTSGPVRDAFRAMLAQWAQQ